MATGIVAERAREIDGGRERDMDRQIDRKADGGKDLCWADNDKEILLSVSYIAVNN